ncbi:hypothetical protein ACHAXN_001401 [Cyclotella atomus]
MSAAAPTRQSRRIASANDPSNRPPPPVSKHSHPTPIDADTVPIMRLINAPKDIQSNRDFLSALDFVNVLDDKL